LKPSKFIWNQIWNAGEAERIRRCNGCVCASKEEPEIQRVWMPNNDNSPGLAMSRSFGDFLLKDYGVIAIPDISYHPLTSSDQFIVLASDGVGDTCRTESYVRMQDSKEKQRVTVVQFVILVRFSKRLCVQKGSTNILKRLSNRYYNAHNNFYNIFVVFISFHYIIYYILTFSLFLV